MCIGDFNKHIEIIYKNYLKQVSNNICGQNNISYKNYYNFANIGILLLEKINFICNQFKTISCVKQI